MADNWREAADIIAEATKPATEMQLKVSTLAGITITKSTPKIVAAAQLRIALMKELHLGSSRPISENSLDLINQLWEGSRKQPTPVTQDEANGWIEHLFLVKRRKALLNLRPAKGDIIIAPDGDYAEISSIGDNGRLYFTGGMGRGAWPDQVTLIAKTSDASSEAEEARNRARNNASLQRPISDWSYTRHKDLQSFNVVDQPDNSLLMQLESVIDAAQDERPIQKFLQDHPCLLAMLVQRSNRYVLPQKRLGNQFVPDFIIGEVDSIGIHWHLIELESPQAPIYLTDGKTLSKQARTGCDQIIEWRNWLQDNVAYARQERSKNGLGLFDIRGDSPGLVLVGRRSSLTAQKKEALRLHYRETSNIHIHTYDWLIESIRGSMNFFGPAALNPYSIDREEIV